MKRVVRYEPEEYSWDIDRIVEAFAERGLDISRSDAKWAWEKYSESMAAGWMSLDGCYLERPNDDSYLVDLCMPYLREEEDAN